jgi:ABC-2 type transport system permease protein
MKTVWVAFRLEMRRLLRYRTAAWAGIATQLVFGAILVAIRLAFARNNPDALSMTVEQLTTYTWLGQAFFAMTPYTTNPDPDVSRMVRDGSIAYELARPVDLYHQWFVRQMSGRLAPTLLRCVPVLVIASLFLGMRLPAGPVAALAWFAATVGALLVTASLLTLVSATLLWTIAGDGVRRLVPALSAFLSGHLIPLSFFPEHLQSVVQALPFAGIVDAPFQIWIGTRPPEDILVVLAHQLAWTVVLVAGGRWLLQAGLRRVVVQGG